MTPAAPLPSALTDLVRAAAHWAGGWWRMLHLGAQLFALALSPSSWNAAQRRALARHMVLGTAPSLMSFTVLTTLLSLVLIRIVLVTSISYGLTQYALEMVVRVLVLELIPLTAALFAALRCTIPSAGAVAVLRNQGQWQSLPAEGIDPLRSEVLPRVIAGVFCALMLAALSCGVTLVLAYLSLYGSTTAGFGAYTHTVGQIFNPGVSLVFSLKALCLGITVALVPVAAVLDMAPRPRSDTSIELQGLVRMFFVILLIEAASLVGNYY